MGPFLSSPPTSILPLIRLLHLPKYPEPSESLTRFCPPSWSMAPPSLAWTLPWTCSPCSSPFFTLRGQEWSLEERGLTVSLLSSDSSCGFSWHSELNSDSSCDPGLGHCLLHILHPGLLLLQLWWYLSAPPAHHTPQGLCPSCSLCLCSLRGPHWLLLCPFSFFGSPWKWTSFGRCPHLPETAPSSLFSNPLPCFLFSHSIYHYWPCLPEKVHFFHFWGMISLDTELFQQFEYFTSLSSCLLGVWGKVWYNSYLVPLWVKHLHIFFPSDFFWDLFFVLIFCRFGVVWFCVDLLVFILLDVLCWCLIYTVTFV